MDIEVKFFTFNSKNGIQLGMLCNSGKAFFLSQAWQKHAAEVNAPLHVGELVALGDSGITMATTLLERHGDDSSFSARLDELEILAPIPRPTKNIFCIGRNYREHIIEGNRARGRNPDDFPKCIEVFTKPVTAIIGHNAAIYNHSNLTQQLDYEVELGIVIGKTGKDISKQHALEFVFGYTIINDITARDLQSAHGQWFKGKGLDTTCPIGPYVVHKSAIQDPHSLSIQLSVNDELRQSSTTADLLFRIDEIIVQLSAGMTLEAGDIIATGTPSGVGLGMTPPRFLKAGDVITARIDGLGELINPVS